MTGQGIGAYERRRRLLAGLGWDPGQVVAGRLPRGVSVLDVGCGSGTFLSLLPDARFRVGVDTDERLVRRARAEVPGATFEVMDAAGIRSLEARFDVVTVQHTLAHLVDPAAALRACRDLLVPGGTLVATVNADEHLREFWEVVEGAAERREVIKPQDALLEFVGSVFPGAGREVVTGRVRLDWLAVLALSETYSVPADGVERLTRHFETAVPAGGWEVTTRLGVVRAVRSERGTDPD